MERRSLIVFGLAAAYLAAFGLLVFLIAHGHLTGFICGAGAACIRRSPR